MAKHNADQLLGADARLGALLAELQRQDQAIEAIEGEKLPPGENPTSEDQEHRLGLANDVRDQIIKEIIGTPARSAAGLRAKAQATMMILDSGIASSAEASNDQLAFALAVDVLAEEAPMRPYAAPGDGDEVLTFGLRLAAAIKEEEGLTDRETATKDVSAGMYLNTAWLHATDETDALRDMIAATTATSLAGAAVQIVEAITRYDRIRGNEGPHHQDERALSRLLHSVLDVVSDAAGPTDPLFQELIAWNEHINPWVPVERQYPPLAEAEA